MRRIYDESLRAAVYGNVLLEVGYRFTPAHLANDAPSPYGERLSRLLRQGAGDGTSYFGFEGYWIAERARDLRAPWLGDCDTAGAPRAYPAAGGERGYYVTTRRSLEPDKTRRYRIIRLSEDGAGESIYTAPGIILMARPLPSNNRHWLISAEGWTPPQDGNQPDPRWQSVYLANLDVPADYRVVEYPISRFPDPPEHGRLYGGSDMLSPDSRFLLSSLYGFRDEGGGLWVADISDERFYEKPDGYARVVPWDHMLSWMALNRDEDGPGKSMSLFLTGKEVADDFAMTANLLLIKGDGLDWSVEHKERLLQMVGWNPVPFALQRLSGNRFRVAVETHLNYENSLLPRAKGVYIVPVDTTPEVPSP